MSESRHALPPHQDGASPSRADGATFSGTTGGRNRPPAFLVVFGLALAALVAVGIGGRGNGAGAGSTPPAGSVAPVAAPSGAIATPIVEIVGPDVSADHAAIHTSAPGPVQLVVRRHPETIFVSGEVRVERVSWVFVSVQDAGRRIVGWTSVSMPGGAGQVDGDGPTFHFAVEIALPEESRGGPLVVQANAYSSSGDVTESATLEVGP